MIKIISRHKGFIAFLLGLLLIRGSLIDWYPVPTGSMKPTILEGDVIFVNKLAYNIQLPFSDISLAETGKVQRGDMIVFTSLKANKRMVKRVVALAGDTVALRDNRLSVNGRPVMYHQGQADAYQPLRRSDRQRGIYLQEQRGSEQHTVVINPAVGSDMQYFGPVLVAHDHYFVLGDNRDNSADSRVYGLIPHHEVRGKALRVLASFNIHDSYWPRLERFWMNLYE